MKLGMLHLFENPIGTTERQVIHDQMELMVAGEDLGFDSVWPAEHHFSEYGFCGSVQVSLAAVAARTSKIRLGTGVVVLPFHHPVRVAEDFAFLDQMSGGRIDFGVGRGYQPREFKGFGVKQEDSREIFDESINLIQKCWTEDSVTFQGKHFQVEDLTVRPKPLQKPHPPIYMACLQPDTFEIVGRYGFNLLLSSSFGLSAERAKEGLANYREARRQAGFDPDGGQVAFLLKVYPGKTMEQARAEFRDPVTWFYRTIAKYVAPPASESAVASYEAYVESRKVAETVEFEDLVDGPAIVCGDVDHCIEKLSRLTREFGFNELLCWTRIGGLENKKVLAAMELLGGEVLPGVRKEVPEAA